MQHSKLIKLDDARAVTVKELKTRDVRRLLSSFTDLSTLDVVDAFGERFLEVSGLISAYIEFPEGEDIDDLTGSELIAVLDGLKEVNRSFLELAGMAPPAEILPIPSVTSTEPASSSLSEDTVA